MSIQFLNGDCLELMKTLPDKSIDCFICDLPYGCLTSSNTGCVWDVKIDLSKFWEQVKRLAKNDHTPVIQFCNTKFGAELIASNPDWFRYDLVWNKERGVSFLSANKMPMRSHENIYIFSKKGTYYKRIDIEGDYPKSHSRGYTTIGNMRTYNAGKPLKLADEVDNTGKRCVLSVINCKTTRTKNQHPTEKPIELYKWLLSRYCPEGGTILDPTAGSFNSCFAGKELGLNCIGIEMNKEFYDKINGR